MREAELVLLAGAPGAQSAAEAHFQEGLEWARRQGALSWELRCAIGLARLRQVQGRSAQARRLLEPVYGRFTEGYATADLVTAKTLLTSLR